MFWKLDCPKCPPPWLRACTYFFFPRWMDLLATAIRYLRRYWYNADGVCIWLVFYDLICEETKRIPVKLAKRPTLQRIAMNQHHCSSVVAGVLWVIDDVEAAGKLFKAHLCSTRLWWFRCGKIKSDFVQAFHRRRKGWKPVAKAEGWARGTISWGANNCRGPTSQNADERWESVVNPVWMATLKPEITEKRTKNSLSKNKKH